jgi:multisubunit Na+/H+ antiporter MnhC subunit
MWVLLGVAVLAITAIVIHTAATHIAAALIWEETNDRDPRIDPPSAG